MLIYGIGNGRNNLDLSQVKICNVCGANGRYEAFVDFRRFSLFFIPLIKWGRK